MPGSSGNIDSVRLKIGHVRITLSPTEDDPPFQLRNLPLWGDGGNTSGKTNPATIPLTGATFTVNVTFTADEPIEYVISAYAGGRLIGNTLRAPFVTKGTTSTEVDVPIVSSEAPWSSGGMVKWEVATFVGNDAITTTSTTPIQVYAIAGDMAPMYKKQGIPRDILDLFIDQYNNTGSSTINDWIKWVVTKCHASTDDPQTTNAIHSYTYNTFCGAARFSSVTQFDLLGWLKLRQNDSPLVMVNCLDQCSLVISVLYLGLPYYLRGEDGQIVNSDEDNQLTTLRRFYKGTEGPQKSQRFGFINKLDLVGWGDCNSPFFLANKANIIVPDSKNTPKVVRESFRNHYFVCYNTIDSNSGNVVQNALDACAGPANDPTVTLNGYLTLAIDAKASKDYGGDTWELSGNVETLEPTNTMNMLALFTPSIKSRWETRDVWKALGTAQGSRTPSTTPIGASLNILRRALLHINVDSSPFDVDIGKDRSSIDIEFSQGSRPFARATIDVMKDFHSAKLQATGRQIDMQRDWDTVFAIPETSQYLGDVNLVAKGELNIAVIIYGNAVIYLEGIDGSRDQFNELVKTIDASMTEAKTATFTPLDTSALVVDMPSETTKGATFNIKITCPGVSELEIASELDIIQFTKGPFLVSEGVWQVNCTTYETGPDRVAFGFAQDGTYYPFTDLVKTIKINAS